MFLYDKKHRSVLVVREGGLEPPRQADTWPSTMPVYQFQHSRRRRSIRSISLIKSNMIVNEKLVRLLKTLYLL